MKTFKQFTEDQKFGPNWDDGVNVRFHSGPNKKEIWRRKIVGYNTSTT